MLDNYTVLLTTTDVSTDNKRLTFRLNLLSLSNSSESPSTIDDTNLHYGFWYLGDESDLRVLLYYEHRVSEPYTATVPLAPFFLSRESSTFASGVRFSD
ncbi:hypothetical protein TNCV_1126781 [Trichonephila clavipes]|nr:hypothetical protein TNCV_1126781 [Trichonephila clavipes]